MTIDAAVKAARLRFRDGAVDIFFSWSKKVPGEIRPKINKVLGSEINHLLPTFHPDDIYQYFSQEIVGEVIKSVLDTNLQDFNNSRPYGVSWFPRQRLIDLETESACLGLVNNMGKMGYLDPMLSNRLVQNYVNNLIKAMIYAPVKIDKVDVVYPGSNARPGQNPIFIIKFENGDFIELITKPPTDHTKIYNKYTRDIFGEGVYKQIQDEIYNLLTGEGSDEW